MIWQSRNVYVSLTSAPAKKKLKKSLAIWNYTPELESLAAQNLGAIILEKINVDLPEMRSIVKKYSTLLEGVPMTIISAVDKENIVVRGYSVPEVVSGIKTLVYGGAK